MLTLLTRGLLLGLALLVLAGSVWWDNAVSRGVAPAGAAPPAWAAVPQGGVNVYNLHAEVTHDERGQIIPGNNVARTFAMIGASGFHWVRMQFPWEDLEIDRKGNFTDTRHRGASTWIKYDYIVAEARRNGLELIVRLDRPPAWARAGWIATPEVQAQLALGHDVTGPPDRLTDFGDYVAAVAGRYPELRFFQIWNEPNLQNEWNYHRQDPAELVGLLRIARDRLRAANPAAVLIAPSLAPTDGLDGLGMSDLEYLQGIYDAGGRDTFDILGAQLYGLGQPPDEHRYVHPGARPLRPIETRADMGRVVLLREIMERNGDSAKAVWVSELGWNSAPPSLGQTWGAPVSEADKGAYLVAAMRRAKREWPWMGAMCVWMFRFGPTAGDPADPTPYFQLVNFDFAPLPALGALGAYLAAPAPALTPPPAWAALLPLLVAVSAALTVAATAWLSIAAAAAVSAGLAAVVSAGQRGARRLPRLPRLSDRWALALMTVALAWLYRASAQLPLTAVGLAVFALLALLRPELALLFVPMTVPLAIAPKGIWDERFGIRPTGIFLPLHEIVLVVATVGCLWLALRRHSWRGLAWPTLRAAWPEWLSLVGWLLAGTLGVVAAAPAGRGDALRSWRWLIVEPLVFYGLARWLAHDRRWRTQLVWAWLGAGVAVAAVGLLQVGGLDLRPIIADRPCFSDAVVVTEGVRRATSIYCHPNNLGLALGRVWPVLAALGLGVATTWRRWRWPLLALAALAGAGLVASFSKGALLGAGAALLVLAWRLRQRWLGALLALGVAALLVVGLGAGIERLNPLGGSSGARLELWHSATLMLRDHPVLGVGLDQFLRLRTAPGSRYISAAAAASSERNAAHPHNLILDILLQTGWLGLAALTAAVVGALGAARRARGPLAAGLVAALAAALVHGLVDNVYFVSDLALSFWLILLLLHSEAAAPHHSTEEAV